MTYFPGLMACANDLNTMSESDQREHRAWLVFSFSWQR
ncbi:hypothetical protein Nizo2776_0089 [Lactiplantibacillus plantarum]|nr:hypothetical protein Nizo2776_0089 [Lactiplantibacillus plantarum]